MNRLLNLAAPFAAALIVAACAQAQTAPAAPVAPAAQQQSILEHSSPAAGSTVSGPVDKLELWFNPPARLLEVKVSSSDKLAMPIMVHAVGEVGYYSLPLSGLGPGPYTVDWKASAAGQSHAGSFSFTVK
jgi:methionine-rich copper-binding protein CopC